MPRVHQKTTNEAAARGGPDAMHACAPPPSEAETAGEGFEQPYVRCQVCDGLFKLGHYASHANQYH